ncbi:MAG: hypothetical protein K6F23_06620 [Solobacterium sp.]|nr:hypothetical protein [Solobacterium sp.]
MNKYRTDDNSHSIREQIRRADRQILINEADIRDLETMIRDLMSENERKMLILDDKNETEGILRYLLQHRCRHDLISRCAEHILNGRFAMHDLLRIFGTGIYTEASCLLSRAYDDVKSITETDCLSCPDPDTNKLVQDPEVQRLFSEYEQLIRQFDQKAEKHEILRYLVTDRYRNELIFLCTRYMLVEDLPVNDLKGMFGPDICAEAFMLYQDLRERWVRET